MEDSSRSIGSEEGDRRQHRLLTRARLLTGGCFLALLGCACADLDSAQCAPCVERCPAGLSCDPERKLCVPDDSPDACLAGSLDGATGTTNHWSSTTAASGTAGGVLDGDGTGTGGERAGGTGSGGSDPTSGGGSGGAASGGSDTTSGGGSGGAASGTTNAGGAGGEGGAEDPCSHSACDPEILNARQLPGICSDGEVYVEFKARCACDGEGASRRLTWAGAAVEGLQLDPETGVLRGSPEPGSYEFDVTVGIDGSLAHSDTFFLSVWDRCYAFLISDDDGAHPEVRAARLDTGKTAPIPRLFGDDAEVSAFDLSPDGKYLAQVEVLADIKKLNLVHVMTDETTPVELEHVGDYQQHAFSRDSHWLAILTTNPDDAATSLLQLVNLATTPAALADTKPIQHLGGIAWSDIGAVLYLGPAADDPYYSDSVREQLVADEGWGGETDYPDTADTYNPLLAFLVSDAGFFTVRQYGMNYRDRSHDPIRQFSPPDWLSPKLGWMAYQLDDGTSLEPANRSRLPGLPYSKAPGCDFIGAWSQDDSTFVCVQTWAPVVYRSGPEGDLTGIPISLPEGLRGPTSRMALSEHGNWFAFVPSDDGLVLLSAAHYASAVTDPPQLERPEGTNEWDFVFTRDERKIIVQRGSGLDVATLGTAEPAFVAIDVGPGLKAVPDCFTEWTAEPDRWCGAPRFRGNLLFSDQDTHLLFIDGENYARAVELATLQPLVLGQISQSCSRDCVRFQ